MTVRIRNKFKILHMLRLEQFNNLLVKGRKRQCTCAPSSGEILNCLSKDDLLIVFSKPYCTLVNSLADETVI
jgi:hypothetical protein